MSQANWRPWCFTVNSEVVPFAGSPDTPEFFGHRLQTLTTRATVEVWHGRPGPNPPHGTSSAWWVILLWRQGTVHELIGTNAARRNSGPRHEAAAGASLISFFSIA